jgi:hypothetical protein
MPAKKKKPAKGSPGRPGTLITQSSRKRADGQFGPSTNVGKSLAKLGKQPAKKTVPESGGVRGETKKVNDKAPANPRPKKPTATKASPKGTATKNAGARKAAKKK